MAAASCLGGAQLSNCSARPFLPHPVAMKSVLITLFGLMSLASGEVFNVALPQSGPLNYPANAPTKHAAPPIDVPEGATLEVLGLAGTTLVEVAVEASGTTFKMDLSPKSTGGPSGGVVAGPAKVTFVRINSVGVLVSYAITTSDESTKSTAAAVPDDNSGDHQVILEASSDLQTWTPVQPGAYPATTTRRFFRVRIQKL